MSTSLSKRFGYILTLTALNDNKFSFYNNNFKRLQPHLRICAILKCKHTFSCLYLVFKLNVYRITVGELFLQHVPDQSSAQKCKVDHRIIRLTIR